MTEQELVDEIVHIAVMGADLEAMRPDPPASETGADYTRRIVSTAVRLLLETGLVVIADDAERRIRDEGIPITPPWIDR